jgi:hypothetical protein
MHSTSNLKDGYLGSGTHLRHAIRKYGVDNFKIEILEWCDTRDKLIEREKEIITENHVNNPNCYNLKFGGLGGGKFINKEHQFKCSQAAGLKHSERLKTDQEYRKKRSIQISESNKKRHQNGEIKPIQEYYSWEGKKHNPETIEKIKSSKKGQGTGESNSQYGSQWINDGVKNKKIKMMGIIPTGWKLGRINKNPSI